MIIIIISWYVNETLHYHKYTIHDVIFRSLLEYFNIVFYLLYMSCFEELCAINTYSTNFFMFSWQHDTSSVFDELFTLYAHFMYCY